MGLRPGGQLSLDALLTMLCTLLTYDMGVHTRPDTEGITRDLSTTVLHCA